MRVQQFFIEGLGHQSYLVSDEASGVAAVIDPRRDIEIYLDAAEREHTRITHVFETHTHNDYVTGALELRARVGATIVTASAAGATYEHLGVVGGVSVAVGSLRFEIIETPGHTPAHISFALYTDGGSAPYAVFTGGSLLVGNAGRTDLVSPGMTLALTRAQYHSLRRLLDTLPPEALVYPTHGAGSFCGATTAGGAARSSTVALERRNSPVAAVADEAGFVKMQLSGYGVYPAYYGYMRDINLAGPRVLGALATLPTLAPATVHGLMRDGIPLIDARPREEFAREHVAGSLNIELDANFGTYTGWLLPFNAPLSLLLPDGADQREALAQLLRIGYEQARGYLDGGLEAWKRAELPTGSFERIGVDTLHQRWLAGEAAVLDVRDETEWRAGHIPGAQHIHIGDLPRHLHELPMERPVAVICRTGHRAAMGASMAAALGREVIAVRDGVDEWIASGYPRRMGATHEAVPELESAHI
ncbi:MAG TPA: MBL fold metallo-hydrolase [Ktedonobacterales bacterium]